MSLLSQANPDLLFGNEAGEEEIPDFLKEVYIESDLYSKAISSQRIVCVRSRKGVGKSALLARAYQHYNENDNPSLWLSPTDLAIDIKGTEYNVVVSQLKQRVARLCVGKMAEQIGFAADSRMEQALRWAEEDGFRSRDFVSQIANTFKGVVKASIDEGKHSGLAPRILANISSGKCLVVFIDDFDRGWEPSGVGSIRIRAIISAIREIIRECDQISFRISLREDVWQFLELNDEQIDKFRQYSYFLKWDDYILRMIIAKRISYYISKHKIKSSPFSDDLSTINLLFERSYKWKDESKNMHDVLTKLSRRRPRDLLQLVKGAASRAKEDHNSKITDNNVRDEYYRSFSKVRVLDLCKEFKNECPKIEALVNAFGGERGNWILSFQEVMQIIKSVNGRIQFMIFEKRASDSECLGFLYRCGFLSARQEISSRDYRHLEYEDAPSLVDAGIGIEDFYWEIHPAFRPHLETIQVGNYQKAKYGKKKRR